ncbi:MULTISPECIES: hypothetical protein [unclassified Methylobacterium]|uniref:hypothetical protein n=1 Tax=unclassified Methylobacterium TaxID=2615210 RepID=UPI0011CA52E5|nr:MULTISPECIES: hypothetical protein [unclassified Methylobacterium]TXM95039.1 hypothetical protein FV223_02260 [Methylobacterium sp. WL116]TXN67743.1 hypothetical protein FV230_13960 [Methylobacterium sp. WL6]
MKHTILASAFLAGLGLGASTLPSAALPVTTTGVAASANADLVQVRMSRRQMRRHRSSGGNANMPSRRPGAKQYGQTTGGPRR